MNITQVYPMNCPYCGETIDIILDCSLESQLYVEDCSVCCRPMSLNVTVDNKDTATVIACRDDDVF